MESPFSSKSWSQYGFEGPQEPGIDYSWIEVQRSLNFVGFDDVVCGCTLFFSSRYPSFFLVKAADGATELWDISDCSFSVLAPNSSVLVVTCGSIFHLSDASASLIELLMKLRKLPADALSGQCSGSFAIEFDQISNDIPKEATDLAICSSAPRALSRAVVTVTGPSIDSDVVGEISMSGAEIKVRGDESEHIINLYDVAKAETTKIGRVFIVLTFLSGEKRDIAFSEYNQNEASTIFADIESELARIQQERDRQ